MSERTNAPGFTLIEMIGVILILGLLGMTFSLSLQYGVQEYVAAREATALSQKARLALTRMQVELVEMQDVRTSGGGTVNGSSLAFLDRDGVAMSFELTGNAVTLNGQDILVDGLGTYGAGEALFTYQNAAGTPWTSANSFDSLYKITILLKMAVDAGGSFDFTLTLSPRKSAPPNAPPLQ